MLKQVMVPRQCLCVPVHDVTYWPQSDDERHDALHRETKQRQADQSEFGKRNDKAFQLGMSKPIDDDRLVCTICPCNRPLEESYFPPRYNDALIGNIGPAIWPQPDLQQRKVGLRCKDIVKRCGSAYGFCDVKFLHAR